MSALFVWLSVWLRSEKAQDLIEYALIIGLLVVVAVIGLNLLGGQISSLWITISAWLNNVGKGITV